MDQAADRLSVRWYLGYNLDESLPDHSSLTRIRSRYGIGVFRRFFETIVDQCQQAGLVWGKELYADATKVQANAAVSSLRPRFAVEAHLNTLFSAAELHLLPSGCTDQYQQYRAKASVCNSCLLKAKCTTSKTGRRLSRHVAEEYLEKVRAYHTTEPYKKAMRKRSVWVEPLFAEGKDWHGMRRYRLRRLWRVNGEALVRATGQNLKRLLKKRGWGCSPWPEGAENALLFGLFQRLQRFFSEREEGIGFHAVLSLPAELISMEKRKLSRYFFNTLKSYMVQTAASP